MKTSTITICFICTIKALNELIILNQASEGYWWSVVRSGIHFSWCHPTWPEMADPSLVFRLALWSVETDRPIQKALYAILKQLSKRHLQGTYPPFGHNRRSDDWLEAGIQLAWNYWCSKGVCSDLLESWALTLYIAKLLSQTVHFMISGWSKNLGKGL